MTPKQEHRISGTEVGSSMPFKVPEKIHLLPSGSFKGRDGRGPYCVVDGDSLIKYSLKHGGGKLVVDYNHQTDFSGPSSATAAPAAGWLTSLYWDKQGLWGRVSWTKKGIAAISSGEYRCISPVFLHEKNGNVSQLLRASLTNDPNLELRALNQRKKASIDKSLSQTMGSGMEDLSPDLAPHSAPNFENRLDRLEKQMHQAHVDRAIASGLLPPALKGWAKEYCRRDPEGFDAFLQKCPVFALANKDTFALPQKPKDVPTLTQQEKSVCRQLGLDTVDFLQHKDTRIKRPSPHTHGDDLGLKGLREPSQSPQGQEDASHCL